MISSQATNVLFVGDMHCKQKIILPYVARAAGANDVDEIVFMGDYVDDYVSSDDDVLDALKYQIKWCKKESKTRSIVNLVGNHDFSYLASQNKVGYYCSGHRGDIAAEVCNLLKKLNLKAAYAWNDTVSTHAGLILEWMNSCNISNSAECAAQQINNLWDDMDSLLYMCSTYRGGYDKYSGPLWLDTTEMLHSSNTAFNQVTSHTPCKTIKMYEFMNKKYSFCVDTFSTDRNGLARGDGSILFMTNAHKQAYSYKRILPEYVGFQSWKSMCSKHRDSLVINQTGKFFDTFKEDALWL